MLVKPLVRPICRAIAGRPTASLGTGFAPTSLFADGSIGVLYDNNDLTSFCLDAAGTTAATVNGLVGLQFDISRSLAIGSEIVPNGAFDSATGWTVPAGWTISGGVATASATGASLVQSSAPGVAGTWYKVEFDWTHVSGTLFVRVGAGPAATFNTSGRKVCYLLAAGAAGVEFYGGVVAGTLDNVTAKPIAGNHRYQTTTGFKPVLRGTPTGSELFTAYGAPGAGWSAAGATGTATTASSALPTTTASVVGKFYRVTYTVTRSAGSVQLSFGGRTGVSRSAAGQYVEYFDNTTNTNVLTATGTSFTGTVRIDEVKDVSAGSVTAPYGLQYDGADDFMQTASVNFSATDKMFVCAGIRKLSDASQGILAELTASVAANNGSFYLAAPNSAAANFAFASKGTVSATDIETGVAAPATRVLSGIGNISGDSSLLRINGVDGTAVTTDQGTGNYSNAVLYFGRRAGTSLPYNGLDFGFCIVGKTLTASQIANTERYIAQRTGVSL